MRFALPTDSGTRIRLPHKVDVTDFLVAKVSVTVIAVVVVNVFCFLVFFCCLRVAAP